MTQHPAVAILMRHDGRMEERAMGRAAPALVYDRIDANRRKTRLLLAAFAALAGPAIVAVGGVIFLPLMALVGTILLLYILQINPYPSAGALIAWAVGAVAVSVLTGVVGAIMTGRQFGTRMVLRLARAKRVGVTDCPVLFHVVEELSIAAGLPTPAVAVIDNAVPNAFAVGHDPATATIAVTRGLLEITDRRQLAGVIGHELAHIGNHDTRLSGVVAVMTAVLAWPILWPFRLTRSRVRLVRQAGRFVLLVVALIVFTSLLACAWAMTWAADPDIAAASSGMPIWWRAFVLFPIVAPLYGLVVAPAAAFVLQSTMSVEREFLADAQAALITRDPGALALALRALEARAGDIPWAASASHLFIADPFGRRPPMWQRWFPTHPEIDARIARLEDMLPGIRTAQEEASGTPVLVVPPQAGAPTTTGVSATDRAGAAEETPTRRHLLRRTVQAQRRALSWRDLPATSLLRVLTLTPLGGLMCLSPVGFFTGVPLLAYGAWPLFSLVGERRLVGTCPSCDAPLDTGSQGRRTTITCSACQRMVLIEGDTFVEGDVANVRNEPRTERPPTAQPTAQAAVQQPADAIGVPVYRDADGWSPVIATIPAHSVVQAGTAADCGNFVQVQVGGTIGYVSRTALVVFDGPMSAERQANSPSPADGGALERSET